MEKIITEVNKEFRKILDNYDTPKTPVPSLLKKINKQFVDVGCTIGKDPIPTTLKPYFLSAKREQEVAWITNTIMGALEKLCLLYFTEPDQRHIFELNEDEKILLDIERGWRRIIWITRNDAFMDDDYFKMIEFNCDSPGGPMYSDVQTDLLEDTPILKSLYEKYDIRRSYFVPQVLHCLLTAYRGWGGSKEKPCIGMIGGRGSATVPEFLKIVDWFKARGYDSTFSDARDLEYNGKDVMANGKRIDIAYRRGWIKDWTDHMKEIKPLIKGYQDGNICVVNPPHSVLGANKSLLGVMQREDVQKKLFNKDEIKVIKENLPWTRLLLPGKTDYNGKKVDIIEFARKNREKLIFKPFDQFGGKDVLIGPDATQKQWEEWIEKGTKIKYVVQEYVKIPIEEVPVVEPKFKWAHKKINVNFFAYNGLYAGGMVRTSDDSVINISKGGGLTPILVVHGKKGAETKKAIAAEKTSMCKKTSTCKKAPKGKK
jgi:glutathionylspermidine synthase